MAEDGGEESSATPLRGSHYQPSPALAIGLLVLFMVCVAIVLHSVNALPVGGASDTSHPHSSTTTSSTSQTTLPRSQVLVQVANGTHQSGLAGTFTHQLQPSGWDALPPINGVSAAKTVIYYKPGFLWAATSIATTLSVAQSQVTPLGTATPCQNAQHDDVVVLLGTNA